MSMTCQVLRLFFCLDTLDKSSPHPFPFFCPSLYAIYTMNVQGRKEYLLLILMSRLTRRSTRLPTTPVKPPRVPQRRSMRLEAARQRQQERQEAKSALPCVDKTLARAASSTLGK